MLREIATFFILVGLAYGAATLAPEDVERVATRMVIEIQRAAN